MDSPRSLLLFLLLLFLFVAPDPQQFNIREDQAQRSYLDIEKDALGVLVSSQYGDFDVGNNKWLNITGLREQDAFMWEGLEVVKRAAFDQLSRVLDAEKDRQILEAGELRSDASQRSLPLEVDIPLYKNVTGRVKGVWIRSSLMTNLQQSQVTSTGPEPDSKKFVDDYAKNITSSEGTVQIKLDERRGLLVGRRHGSIREISATMTISGGKTSRHGWDVRLRGVHYPEYGSVILTTTSKNFLGLFALPHFMITEHTYSLAQQLLNKTITDAIAERDSRLYLESTLPWSAVSKTPSYSTFGVPSCEYLVYLQQHQLDLADSVRGPLSSLMPVDLAEAIETELSSPNGAPIPRPPLMGMSALIYSPDCGFLVESKGPPQYPVQEGAHLQGQKLEASLRLATVHLTIFASICGAQIWSLIRQMKDASTPSTVSRISFYTIIVMALGDGFACLALTVGVFVDAVFLSIVTTAFLASLGVSFFGMRFLIDIWTVQAPERRERQRRTTPTVLGNQEGIDTPSIIFNALPTRSETLPLPVTASQISNSGAIPVILPPDQDLGAAEIEDESINQAQNGTQQDVTRRETGAIYARFYLFLLGAIFFSLQAMSWPRPVRLAYYRVLAFVYFSLWTPQIYRNVMRNCRKALCWEFVVGQSFLRLSPFLYFYANPENILYVEVDHITPYFLVGWVWLQLCTLFSQEILGPRFFVPASWVPPAYDYHPVIREADLEDGHNIPVGFSQATGDAQEHSTSGEASSNKNKRTFDCAICMQNVEVPIIQSGKTADDSAVSIGGVYLGRRSYMVTPCRHVFHTQCLEQWMRFRLQCPICRDPLVPL